MHHGTSTACCVTPPPSASDTARLRARADLPRHARLSAHLELVQLLHARRRQPLVLRVALVLQRLRPVVDTGAASDGRRESQGLGLKRPLRQASPPHSRANKSPWPQSASKSSSVAWRASRKAAGAVRERAEDTVQPRRGRHSLRVGRRTGGRWPRSACGWSWTSWCPWSPPWPQPWPWRRGQPLFGGGKPARCRVRHGTHRSHKSHRSCVMGCIRTLGRRRHRAHEGVCGGCS